MMGKQLEIETVSGRDVIPYLHWIKDIPVRKQVDSEPIESIIIKTLQGVYHGLLGSLDGEPCALLLYHLTGKHHIVLKLMCARHHMVDFYKALMEYLHKYEINSFEFESIHEPKLWDRMYPDRIKKIRSTYSFDVAGMYEYKSQQKRSNGYKAEGDG